MKKFLFLFIFLILLGSVNAVNPIITVELPNYFTTTMTSNTWYYKNVDLSDYEHYKLSTFSVILTADYQSDSEIMVKVGNTMCSPNVWTTPNVQSLNYKSVFDCSNAFSETIEGDVVIGYKVSNGANNMKPQIELSYFAPPETSFDVLGTYYEVGDTAKIIAQLSTDGVAINNASCFVSIYHPDNTVHIRNTFMTNVPNSDGLYTYDMPVENWVGVYPVSVVCDFITKELLFNSINTTFNLGDSDSVLSNIDLDDELYYIINTSIEDELVDRIDVDIEFDMDDYVFAEDSKIFLNWQGYTDLIGEEIESIN